LRVRVGLELQEDFHNVDLLRRARAMQQGEVVRVLLVQQRLGVLGRLLGKDFQAAPGPACGHGIAQLRLHVR